ncbi:MAG: hypothetical protein SFU85_05415 [Candidatus Methylacidiphilales bacterium]|nr:hypothetical protein [Candidatus Methylacidiphilales bacterium]
MSAPLKLLFICGRNKRRSPTAERLYKNDRRFQVRAAGLGETSPRRVNAGDVAWADLILPMERKNAVRLKVMFPQFEPFPPMEILDICDDFKFMDRKLLEILPGAVDAAVERYQEEKAGTAD